jgi:hypothetical protein
MNAHAGSNGLAASESPGTTTSGSHPIHPGAMADA